MSLSRKEMIAACMVTIGLAVAACGATREAEVSASMPSSEEVEAELQKQAEKLFALEFPGVRATEIRLSEDGSVACGYIEVSDRPPALFVSFEDTPSTVERTLMPPVLTAKTARHLEIAAERSALVDSLCRQNGLLPDGAG